MPMVHRILIVDDDREFANQLCGRLLKCGYQVTALHHPRQALEAASVRDYEVAVLDRCLPEIDGVRLMEMLKRRIANLQVVLLFGGGGAQEKHDSDLSRGASACLIKPCQLGKIEAAIEQALERRGIAPIATSSAQTSTHRELSELFIG